MLAAYAARFSPDSPVDGLEIGQRSDPVERENWTVVKVRAASLNHHDLWSLRGVGLRADVAPVPALAGLDRHRVAYLGTASKSVAPSLRLGWLVPPPALLERLNARRQVTHDGAAWPVQRAMVALLRDGYVDKVVRTARRVYAERAPRVAAALSPYAQLAGPLAGMYSTWLLRHDDAVRAVAAARAAGFEVPLLAQYARSSGVTGLVVGFGGVSDAELDAALAALVRGLRRRPARPAGEIRLPAAAQRASSSAARAASATLAGRGRRAPPGRARCTVSIASFS